MSLKDRIYYLIKSSYPAYVNGGEAERLAERYGKKASNGSRRCRDLVSEGKIERRINEKHCVEYRWKVPYMESQAFKELSPEAQEEERMKKLCQESLL